MENDFQLVRRPGVARLQRREAWRRILILWQQSGLSARRFAEQHGLRSNALFRWREKLPESTPSASATFVELDVSSAGKGCALEVHVGDLRVLVHNHCDANLLRNLMHTLQERPC